MMSLPQLKGNSSWLTSLSWDIGLFPVVRIELKHWLLGLKLAIFHAGIYTISSPPSQTFGLGLELHHLLSWISSLLTSDLRTSNHPRSGEPIPYDKYLSILSVLFLWRTLTNTGRQGNFIMEKWGWHHLQPPISLSISKIEKQQITCTLKSDVTGNTRHYSVSLYFSGGRHGKTDSSASRLFRKLSQETPLVEWYRNKKVAKSIKSVLSSRHCGRLELIFSRELWTWTSEFWTLNLSFRVYHLRELG